MCQKPNGQEKVLDQFREQRGRRRLCEVLGPCYCCCCQVASVMSDSMQPHRRQPTRLLRPWDSPGKNTGVGCHFLLQCMKVKSESEVTQSCTTLSDAMDCSLPGRLLRPWDFPGKSTGVGCHCLLHYTMLPYRNYITK